MKPFTFLTIIVLLLPLSAHARLGETERELIARFGQPDSRSNEYVSAQGRMFALCPILVFRKDDWQITCDLIDDRCARISYYKRGDWTEDQFLTVLTVNAQGAKWTEVANRPLVREWKREDGAIAHWQAGQSFFITTPAFERAKQAAVARENAAVRQIPKL
jgi:hypothetical protein